MNNFSILTVSFILAMSFQSVYAYSSDDYKIETIAENLEVPWEIDFVSDGRIIFSEKTGSLRVIENGTLKPEPLISFGDRDGSLLGFDLDPNFDENHYIYLFYHGNGPQHVYNVGRFILDDNGTSLDTVLVEGIETYHSYYGGRIKFGPDGLLYITTGEPSLREPYSQNIKDITGKILRIYSNGTIPSDNPFDGSPIYSLGHRNPHGIDWDPLTGKMVITEHGPTNEFDPGHDEINIVVKGGNYGFPIVFGDGYDSNFISPLIQSGNETWAPDGAIFYSGDLFSEFKDKYLVANLKGERLQIFDIDTKDEKIRSIESLFENEFGRIRTVEEGPDGSIYLLTSNTDGRGDPFSNDDRIIRIMPANTVYSPLQQLKMGISIDGIVCRDSFILVTNGERVGCVSGDTSKKLSERGWKIT